MRDDAPGVLFSNGRSLSLAAGSLARTIDSIGGSHAALGAARDSLAKVSDLLRQARDLAGSIGSAGSGVDTGADVGSSEPQISREYVAVDQTGSVSLRGDVTARVVGTKAVAGATVGGLQTVLQNITITVGGATTTINLGLLGLPADQLRTQIDNVSGVKASFNQAGQLVIEEAIEENPAAVNGFTVGGSADVQQLLGIQEQTYGSTSLLTQGVSQGQTLTFRSGDGPVQTITFGAGQNQVSSVAELEQALGSLDGVTASIDAENRLTFRSDDPTAPVTVGGTANTEVVFGVERRTYDPIIIETVIEPEPAPEPQPSAATQDAEIRKALADIRVEIDASIAEAETQGVNLLRSGAIDVLFAGEAGASKQREGSNLSADALGLDVLAPAANASLTDIEAAIAGAIQRVDLESARNAADSKLLEARSEFSTMRSQGLKELDSKPAEDATGGTPANSASNDEINRIAAETRKLFAESLLPGEDGIVENDRAVLEELFSVAQEKQNP